MTYPPPPGQYPNSGGFPQPPGQFPGMSPYPGGAGEIMRPKPNGGTAIAAGVLAAIGAVFGVIFAMRNFGAVDVMAGTKLSWVPWMQAIAYVVEVITLGPGSILLFVRKGPGRWLVLTGSVVQIAQGITALIAVLSSGITESSTATSSEIVGASAGGLLVVLAPAIATAILAALPLTGRWLAWNGQQSGYGVSSAYGPPPGVGQQPGFGQPPALGQQPGIGQPPALGQPPLGFEQQPGFGQPPGPEQQPGLGQQPPGFGQPPQ